MTFCRFFQSNEGLGKKKKQGIDKTCRVIPSSIINYQRFTAQSTCSGKPILGEAAFQGMKGCLLKVIIEH